MNQKQDLQNINNLIADTEEILETLKKARAKLTLEIAAQYDQPLHVTLAQALTGQLKK